MRLRQKWVRQRKRCEMDRETIFKGLFASVATYLTFLVGEVNQVVQILVTLMVIDYVTGFISAWTHKTLDSHTGFRGISKKVLMLLLVIVAHQFDKLVGTNGLARTATMYFLIANDGLSILENLAECGVPIPAFLLKALALMREKADSGSTEITGGDNSG